MAGVAWYWCRPVSRRAQLLLLHGFCLLLPNVYCCGSSRCRRRCCLQVGDARHACCQRQLLHLHTSGAAGVSTVAVMRACTCAGFLQGTGCWAQAGMRHDSAANRS